LILLLEKNVFKRKNREKRKQKNSGHLKQKGNGINPCGVDADY